MDPTNVNPTPWYQSLIDNVAKLGTSYLSIEQQKQLNELNIQRAKQGLAPLDTSQYQTGVQVGLSSTTQQTLLYVAGGVGLVILLSSLMKSRR